MKLVYYTDWLRVINYFPKYKDVDSYFSIRAYNEQTKKYEFLRGNTVSDIIRQIKDSGRKVIGENDDIMGCIPRNALEYMILKSFYVSIGLSEDAIIKLTNYDE